MRYDDAETSTFYAFQFTCFCHSKLTVDYYFFGKVIL